MCQTKRKLHNQCHTGGGGRRKMGWPSSSVIYLIVIVQTAGWWRLGLARRKFTLLYFFIYIHEGKCFQKSISMQIGTRAETTLGTYLSLQLHVEKQCHSA